MKVIFLDIDGVLNSVKFITDICKDTGYIRPEHDVEKIDPFALLNLAEIINSEDDVKIVISSSWRLSKDLDSIRSLFAYFENKFYDFNKFDIKPSSVIIDRTPFVTVRTGIETYDHHEITYYDKEEIRGMEIKKWLERYSTIAGLNKITGIVIIDDDDDMGKMYPYLVRTDNEVGLIAPDVIKAKKILQQPWEQ